MAGLEIPRFYVYCVGISCPWNPNILKMLAKTSLMILYIRILWSLDLNVPTLISLYNDTWTYRYLLLIKSWNSEHWKLCYCMFLCFLVLVCPDYNFPQLYCILKKDP